MAGLAAGIWLGYSWPVHANEMAVLQREIQARFLYNFASLTEWPSNAFSAADSPVMVGVLGVDPFGKILNNVLTNRLVAGRAIVVRRVVDSKDIGNCHILFISTSESARLTAILKTLDGHSILTVSDSPGFADQGGMIEFVSSSTGEVTFKINNASANRAGLQLSSHLLKLRITEIIGPKAETPGRFACPRFATCQFGAS